MAADIKLRRLTLFSSGVGFFEHGGDIEGDAEITLPFNEDAVNDALKSIVINDPDSSPVITYHSEDTLRRTLKGLSVDLYKNEGLAEFLKSLQGAEIEVFVPNALKGRILLVEERGAEDSDTLSELIRREAYISLLTDCGVRVISLKEISGFNFTDPKINADANRALDLIVQSRDSGTKNLTVKLPGKVKRGVTFSYVIPVPVWKVSYRLDLSREKPFLQGWAIVDNNSDTDFEEIELSLVTGRPVSFIQDLYAPYHMSRPTLPLAIAGIAKASVYERGSDVGERLYDIREEESESRVEDLLCSFHDEGEILGQSQIDALMREDTDEPLYGGFAMTESGVETARGRAAGEQFEFTVKRPVSLVRRQSAMLPLVEGSVHAEKMLIFSGGKVSGGVTANPAIGAELVNNTDMKLPAGAITVYDAGTYAGDSLITFFPENEKQIISYGEDLSVMGRFSASAARVTSAGGIVGGVMALKIKVCYKRMYTFINASGETKRLIVEHPFASKRAELTAPCEYMEKTAGLYRFEFELPPGELNFEVMEEELRTNEVTLLAASDASMAGYASDEEFPRAVREGLKRAIELKQKETYETEKIILLKKRLTALLNEQERTRKNLAAAGPTTQQGQEYLSRLAAADNEIDAVNRLLDGAELSLIDAKESCREYIQKMYIEESIADTPAKRTQRPA